MMQCSVSETCNGTSKAFEITIEQVGVFVITLAASMEKGHIDPTTMQSFLEYMSMKLQQFHNSGPMEVLPLVQ